MGGLGDAFAPFGADGGASDGHEGGPAELGDGDEANLVVLADGPGSQEQLVVGHGPLEMPARRPIFAKCSPAHIAHARAHRQAAVAVRRADRACSELATSQAALQAIVASLLGAAPLLGRPQKGPAIGVRKGALKPEGVLILTRALHLTAETKVQLGVKLRRLICLGALVALQRQRSALNLLLMNAKLFVQQRSRPTAGHANLVYLWDEVQAKFKNRSSKPYRDSRQTVSTPTLVPQGVIGLTMCDKASGEVGHWSETWLCSPARVSVATASGLIAGVMRGIPQPFRFDSLLDLGQTAQQVDSITFMPCCDKASSNVSILKHWGATLDSDIREKIGYNVLLWPETCGIHSHNRAKLQVKGLRAHTMVHFSISNLYKLRSIQERMLSWVEANVPHIVRRVVGAPPEGVQHTLLEFVDVLFDLNAPHHERLKRAQVAEACRSHGLVHNRQRRPPVWGVGAPLLRPSNTAPLLPLAGGDSGKGSRGDGECTHGRERSHSRRKPLDPSSREHEAHLVAAGPVQGGDRLLQCGACGGSRGSSRHR